MQEVLQITVGSQVVRQVVVIAVSQLVQVVETRDETPMKLDRICTGQVRVLRRREYLELYTIVITCHLVITRGSTSIALSDKRTLTYGTITVIVVS